MSRKSSLTQIDQTALWALTGETGSLALLSFLGFFPSGKLTIVGVVALSAIAAFDWSLLNDVESAEFEA
jgi:hypothetical protein